MTSSPSDLPERLTADERDSIRRIGGPPSDGDDPLIATAVLTSLYKRGLVAFCNDGRPRLTPLGERVRMLLVEQGL